MPYFSITDQIQATNTKKQTPKIIAISKRLKNCLELSTIDCILG